MTAAVGASRTGPARQAGAGVTRTASAVFAWVVGAAGLNLVVAALTTRTLPVGARGEAVLLLTISGITGMLCGAGTNTAARYHLPRGHPDLTVGHYLGLSATLALPQTVVTLAVAVPTLAATGAPERGPALIAATAALSATTLLTIQLLDALNAVGLLLASAVVNAAGSLLQLSYLAALLASGRTGSATWVLSAFAAAGVGQVLTALWLIDRACHPVRPRLARRLSRLLVRTGAPALGLNVGASLAFRLDRYLVGVFLGVGPVAIYGVAATTSECLRLLPSAWGQVTLHRVATGAMTPRATRRHTRRVVAAMAVLAAVLAAGAGPLVDLVFGPAYRPAVGPVRILLLAELLLVSFQIDARVLAGLGRTAACGAAGLAGVVAVAALDVVLIPWAGLAGAAWASVAAYGLMSAWAGAAVTRGAAPVSAPVSAATPGRRGQPTGVPTGRGPACGS